MSIIERAMNTLEGARSRMREPASKSPGTFRAPVAVGHARGTHPSVARLKAETPTPTIIEEFRRIKRPLLANAFGKKLPHVENGNVIMVTSSISGEGKTFTSINLALAIASEADHNVTLVDADIAKQNVSRLYGLERRLGLIDSLATFHRDLNGVCVPTDVEGLTVIPSGRKNPRAAELLASHEMGRLIERLTHSSPEHVVIFDAPPLLAGSEPQSLAELVGQIVLVVEAGRTPRYAVKDAIEMLGSSKAIGLVFNKSEYSLGFEHYSRKYEGYESFGDDAG